MIPREAYPYDTEAAAARSFPSLCRVAFEQGPFPGGGNAAQSATQAEVVSNMPTDSPEERCACGTPHSASPKGRIGVPLDEIGQIEREAEI